jgi:UDP-glucuronate 4-epimerase
LIVLITGAAGFIGYHLATKMVKSGYKVIGIDNINSYYDTSLKNDRIIKLKKNKNFKFKKIDISDKEAVSQIFKMYKPKKVINLAAQAGVQYSIKNPFVYMQSNLVGFLNIIEMCRNYDVRSFVYASSSSVYGNSKKNKFNVKDKTEKPISLYGATKKANELIAHSYSSLYGLKTTGLRYFTVYGPWYRPDMAIYIFTKKILNNEKISLYNNGNINRDFTYIDDIIDGTIKSINKNYECEVFNLGNSVKEKLMNVVNIIEKEVGKKAIINLEPIKNGDMVDSCASIKYSIDMLGYNPKTSINTGIPKFIKWYREYYDV